MAEEKLSSLRALDAPNFCNAGIQTGLGPFLAIYYTSVRHWNPGEIGILISCQAFAGIAVHAAAGNWIDESHRKRLLTAIASSAVALGAIGIVTLPTFSWQITAQILIGLAVTIFPAVTSAFALGMVGERELASRIARNEVMTHTGNVAFAISTGVIGTVLALQGIFLAAAVFASGMIPSVLFIKNESIDYESARAGTSNANADEETVRRGWRQLCCSKSAHCSSPVVSCCITSRTPPRSR
jgi:MFS family permease